MKLYWRYRSEEARRAGALAPEAAKFDYGQGREPSPPKRSYVEKWRAIEAGGRREASDCPPMRAMARTGYMMRAPVRTVISGRPYSPDRSFSRQQASGAAIIVSGDAWPNSDSGYAASWIAGSDHFKIMTGIDLLCPLNVDVLQGPPPNADLIRAAVPLSGYTAIERAPGGPDRSQADGSYIVELNFIYRAPPVGKRIVIDVGTIIGWFLPVPRIGRAQLEPSEALSGP